MINKAAGQHAASAQVSVRVNMISNAVANLKHQHQAQPYHKLPFTGCTGGTNWHPLQAANCSCNNSVAAQRPTSATHPLQNGSQAHLHRRFQ
jgi:hypothetical protein